MGMVPPSVMLPRQEYELEGKPKDEPLTREEYTDKYERLQVEYPDSKKHVGLLYDPFCRQTLDKKREIIKRFMDDGWDYTEWYAAPVWDLARELGLVDTPEEQYYAQLAETMNTCKPVLVPSVDKALISHEVPPLGFDSVMDMYRFCRMMDIVAGTFMVTLIVAIPLVLAWILR